MYNLTKSLFTCKAARVGITRFNIQKWRVQLPGNGSKTWTMRIFQYTSMLCTYNFVQRWFEFEFEIQTYFFSSAFIQGDTLSLSSCALHFDGWGQLFKFVMASFVCVFCSAWLFSQLGCSRSISSVWISCANSRRNVLYLLSPVPQTKLERVSYLVPSSSFCHSLSYAMCLL